MVVLATLATVSAGRAAPGDADRSFGTNGVVTFDAGGNEISYGVLVDDEGRIVQFGATDKFGPRIFLVARFDRSGNLDSTFGGGAGFVTFDLGGGLAAEPLGGAIDSQGRIVIVGYRGASDTAVVRLLDDGSLDTSFSTDGIVVFPVSGDVEYAMDVAIDTSDRPVVVGYFDSGPNWDAYVARFEVDGDIDPTFGTAGVTVLQSDQPNAEDYATSVLIDDTGKLIVGGASGVGAPLDLTVYRLSDTGSLDLTFDTDGLARFDTGITETVEVMTFDAAGRIVTAGLARVAPPHDVVMSRVQADGTLDNTFDTDGVAFFDNAGESEFAKGIAVDSKGRILVAGQTLNPPDLLLLRYDDAGVLDPTFDGDGVATFDLGAGDSIGGFALDDRNHALIGATSDGDFALVRVDPEPRPGQRRPSRDVERIAGVDDSGTASLVTLRHRVEDGPKPVALVATDELAPDALAASGTSRDSGVFLTDRESVPQVTIDSIAGGGFSSIVVVGSEDAVGPSAFRQLSAIGLPISRAPGVDRYETALAMSRLVNPDASATSVWIAAGDSHREQLIAASSARMSGGSVLWAIPGRSLSTRVLDEIRRMAAPNATINVIDPRGVLTAVDVPGWTIVRHGDVPTRRGTDETRVVVMSSADWRGSLAAPLLVGPARGFAVVDEPCSASADLSWVRSARKVLIIGNESAIDGRTATGGCPSV